jgi:hypothetical protein
LVLGCSFPFEDFVITTRDHRIARKAQRAKPQREAQNANAKTQDAKRQPENAKRKTENAIPL